MAVLIFLFFAFFLFLAWRRLDWAVMFLIFALPSYLIRFKFFGLPLTVLELMILSVFFVWFLKNWRKLLDNFKNKFLNFSKENNLQRYPFDIEIILLVIISFIATGVADFSDKSLGIWKAYFFEPLLFYIVIFNLFIKNTMEKKQKFFQSLNFIIYPLIGSVFFISILAIYQKITGNLIDNPFWAASETRRVVSFFGYPNAVGLYLAPLIFLFLGYLLSLKNNKVLKLFLLGAIIFSLISVVFAKSLGAIVGIIIGVIFFGFLSGKNWRIITLIILISSFLVIYFSSARDSMIKHLTLKDFSGQVRIIGWQETWKMLCGGRFFWGAGLANFQKEVAPYHAEGFFYNKDNDPDFERKIVLFDERYKSKYWQPLEIYLYPHNIFLNFWSELGLIGMILFVWIIVKFYYLNIKILKNFKIKNYQNIENKYFSIGLLSSMTVIVIHGLVDVPYFKNDLAVIFWIFIFLTGANFYAQKINFMPYNKK